MSMKRRQFLKSSALGTMAGGLTVAAPLAQAGPPYNEEILVYIFLRGGIDCFNFVVPLADDHTYYSLMRPVLAIPDSGPGEALPLGAEPFGLNPLLAPLKDLYDSSHLAIVQATGTADDISSRSHFDAEKYIELGTPGNIGTFTGWLHRHFLSMTDTLDLYPEEIFLPIVAFRNNPPSSLLGNSSSLTVWSPEQFRLDNAHWRWGVGDTGIMQLDMLPAIYNTGVDPISNAGSQALAAEELLRTTFDSNYTGAGSIAYQDDDIGRQMKNVAQLIELGAGTRIFTLDYGNFDTHSNQNDPGAYGNKIDYLGRALASFFDDLESSGGSYADRTTVIIQSEFGRRLYQNNSNGTDHGNGNMLLALGKNVNGGKLYGDWPGLYPGTEDDWVDYPNPKNGSTEPELFQGALSVTTDFRRILSEYLHKRGQHTTQSREFVFPGYTGYSPMGIFNAIPEPDDMIFNSGFE